MEELSVLKGLLVNECDILREKINQLQYEAERHKRELLKLVTQFVGINAKEFPEEIVIANSEAGNYLAANMLRMVAPFDKVLFSPNDNKFYEATDEFHETAGSHVSFRVVRPKNDGEVAKLALNEQFVASL